MIERELFTLLRLGLGTGTVEKEDISALLTFSEQQWEELKETACFQGVLGIVLDGIDQMPQKSYVLPKQLRLQWIGEVLQNYEAGNMQQLLVIDSVQREWAKAGIRMMVMKGQAMGTYYPNPKHRSPGDIDCYLFEDYAKGNEMAKAFADKVDEGWYKHSQISVGGQIIENHQYFVHTRDGKRSKALNQVLVDALSGSAVEIGESLGGALLPPPMFNALFLTYHAMTHFLEEGLKMKQVLDWAMFLHHDADKVDWGEFYRLCDRFHMRRFADVMTDVVVRYLGVDVTQILQKTQITTTSPYTEKVLHSTLYDQDYVFSSGEGGWKNRWHIVRNLWKYRWKYEEIYQTSVWKQLWWYATGFLFKTE
ncbi:MAG: nucleotidyltransferase family protein [Bacteroidales bacterium]|nr:nucleotidyltransferase family protein [Bacteroidales bacterium]